MGRHSSATGGTCRKRNTRYMGPATERERERAATKLQGLYRCKMAMRRLRVLTRQVYEKVLDPETGAYFYHNTHTGDVAWISPKLLGSEKFDVIDDDKVSPHDKVTTYRRMAKEWEVHLDEGSGANYYFNTVSQETTWEKPDVVAILDTAIEERDEMLGPDWSEEQDESHNYFFHNNKTGESLWEPPKVNFRISKEKKVHLAKEAKSADHKAQKAAAQAPEHTSKDKATVTAKVKTSPKSADDVNNNFNGGSNYSPSSPSSTESSLDSSDDDSEPPEALEIGEDGKIEDPAKTLLGLNDSTDDDSVYISSEDEFEGLSRELKTIKTRRKRRNKQRERHLANLRRLAFEDEKDRKAYTARARMKRCRKRQNRSLGLCDLELEAVPQDVVTNPKLFKLVAALDLGLNKIQRVPRMIKRLAQSLEELVLDSNRLVHVPVQLWYCVNLRVLDLRNNRLRELAREKGNMQVLREMNIWEIGIESLQALQVLRLDRNDLDLIPQHICKLKALEHLSARANRITAVPERGLDDLQSLSHLDLSENYLSGLPEKWFGKLKTLERLNVGHNVLGALPDDLGGANKITSLRACHNRLKQLPLSFGELERLELLSLEHNALTTLPADWSRMAFTLRSVNLAHNQLASLPASIGKLSALMYLDVSCNTIKPALPADIAKMTRLRSLNASENELNQVGFDDWSGLDSLVQLNLSRNNLRAISLSSIFSCPQLQTCDVSHNKLTELSNPKQIMVSTSLHDLNLSCNEITCLPKELFSKSCLRKLDLSDNKIAMLSSEISDLKDKIEWLNLDKNKIRALPDELSEMKKLRFISLCYNQLKQHPKVLETIESLQSWQLAFNSIEQKESREAWRQRLLAEANMLQAEGKSNMALEQYDKVYTDLVSGANRLSGTGDDKGDDKGDDCNDGAGQNRNGDPNVKVRVQQPSVVALRDPVVREEQRLLEEILRKRGTTLLSLEKYDEALNDFNDALGLLDKPTSDLLYYRGVVLFRGCNNPTAAVADLDKAVEINPLYKPGYRQRSSCLNDLGHYDKALSDACTVIEFDMFDEEAFFLKGLALERLQRLEEALEAYKQTINLCMGGAHEDNDDDMRERDQGNVFAMPALGESKGKVAGAVDGDVFASPKANNQQKQEQRLSTESNTAKLKELLSTISPWSPLGITYYRCGLIKRDLDKISEAVVQFKAASDVLNLQYNKACPGSLRKKTLAETLKLSIIGRSSALQTMNRTNKAIAAYIEAMSLGERME